VDDFPASFVVFQDEITAAQKISSIEKNGDGTLLIGRYTYIIREGYDGGELNGMVRQLRVYSKHSVDIFLGIFEGEIVTLFVGIDFPNYDIFSGVPITNSQDLYDIIVRDIPTTFEFLDIGNSQTKGYGD